MPFDPGNVRAEMARKKKTAADIARETGRAESTIRSAASDDGNPTKEVIEDIARALNVDSVVFFTPTRKGRTPKNAGHAAS